MVVFFDFLMVMYSKSAMREYSPSLVRGISGSHSDGILVQSSGLFEFKNITGIIGHGHSDHVRQALMKIIFLTLSLDKSSL